MGSGMIRIFVKLFFTLTGCIYLVSCGSATNRGPSTIILGTAPPPPPVTAPINFNTSEFRNNYGLPQLNALTAYENGATGQGITVAVIDSGIDIDHPQIEANIHVDSTNIVTGNKADLNDTDGHGTAVAGVIAAIRDPDNKVNTNTHGVAFNAQVMAINTAVTGSCDSMDGCTFSDRDIAAALDYARVRNVKVVNISLGGDGFNSLTLVNAYKRAVAAGMVIVLAAGNREDEDTDATVAQPENSASVAWAGWANGQIIVAGAVGKSSIITDFSHRAGAVAKDVFLVAAGERILSLGADGGFFFWSGTSFSTPHISGAAALLFDAFPNLTGKQVAELLLSTATDLGEIGADVIYGRGLVNLAAAFSPQGTTSIAVRTPAGETAVVDLAGSALLGGEAFGGFAGLSASLSDSMILDGFDRSFRVDLGQRVFGRNETIRLDAFIGSRRGSRTSSLQFSPSAHVRFSWTEDWRFQEVDEYYFSHQNNAKNRSRDLRMKLGLSLGRDQDITFAQGLSLKEAMGDYDQNEFLTIGKDDFVALMGRNDSQSMIFDQKLTSRTRLGLVFGHGGQTWQQYDLKADTFVMMARVDHALSSSVNVGFDLGVMDEKGSVLGSLSNGAVSLGTGAVTTFVNTRFNLDIARGVNFFARASYGLTNVRAADLSLVEGVDSLTSGSLSIGMTGNSLFQQGDRLSFAVSQPLRVMGGHAEVSFVTARNFETDSLSFVSNQVALTPGGREIDFELAYRVANLFGAQVEFNILHQISPNHSSATPDNTGILVRFGSEF
ncbi:MAG: hypothetical protein COB49_02755 [Alphaproteobacteria bacterium]|nr:MAG: hypothetical protein COB49_02755 [Alphaproteobacteria bacterium]